MSLRVQVLTELYPGWEGGQGTSEPAPGAVSGTRSLFWGDRRDPTTSCTEGETETNSTHQGGLAWESAVLSLLPAGKAPLDSVSPSVAEEAGLPHSLPGSDNLKNK